MKNITLIELEAEKQKCINAISTAIQHFKTNTGILDAVIQINGSSIKSKDGFIVINYDPSIRITL